MKICRFDDDRVGIVLGEEVADVTDALQPIATAQYPFPRHDVLVANLERLRPAMDKLLPDAPRRRLADVQLLSPVANPGKIVCAPVNYADHLAEAMGEAEINHGKSISTIAEAGLFLKATSALQGCSHGVVIEHEQSRNDHEIELVAIMGTAGRNIRHDEALSHIAGYAIGLDMTVRGPQDRSMRKSVDTFAILGPWMVTADEIRDPEDLDLLLSVNGEVRQRANTRDLVMKIADLIAFATSYYSLAPGDLLFTGTPAGVGAVQPGDRIQAHIDGIGSMDVPVRGKRGVAR